MSNDAKSHVSNENAAPNDLHILHLEDSVHDAELIAYELRKEWPECRIQLVNGEAPFVAALKSGRIDVVISDFALGNFDGFAALKRVHEFRPEVPFILVSGTIGEERAVATLKAGAVDYVLKDRPARLVPAIRRALRDIADQRSRLETENRFRQLAETSSDVFWFADLNPLRVRYISPAVETIWGHRPDEFYQHPDLWLARVHPEDRPRVEKNFNAWIGGEHATFSEEFRVIRPDGSTRWVLDTGTFARDATGQTRRISGVARDITATKDAAEQSLRAQRLESIGLLAGGVAHDLNNALAPILMGLELLRPEVSPRSQALFDQMQVSANRGAAMVRQLLGFARGAEGQRSIIRPQHALREVEQLAASTFPKEITISVQSEENVPHVEVDPTLLHQVLLNLCVNARDAMPRGGSILLELESVHVDESYAGFIRGAKPGRYVVFKVSDTGTGIRPEVMPRIFDPFFTTKAMGVGTGLGLTTVAGIVHNHGGFVRVHSEIGKGTCFKIFLPAVGSNSTAPFTPRTAPEYRAQGEGVLVVDDEEAVRLLLKNLLERFGFRVFLTSDGTEALATYALERAHIKLVMTDERMPHMDGLTLARTLRHMNAELRIIAMSGLHSEAHVREFAAVGVTNFLHKPFGKDQLIDAIRACFDAGREQQQLDLRK